MDPRLDIVGERLAGIGKIIPVSGGKGGVGKSVLSSCLALSLARAGRKVGLLDLDLSSPSQHTILGARDLFPKEDRGILPPVFHGIHFMSLSFFTGDRPAPLRGTDISNAIIELLAITRWGELDRLVVDMPPGLSDAALDVIRLMPKAESLLVTVPSKVSFATVGKVIGIFQELGVRMAGVVENMVLSESGFVRAESARLGVPYLGAIPYDRGLEEAVGDPARLERTGVLSALEKVIAEAGGL
ncbi:MAG: ATP-binding protein [Elusimicrobia bacterium GWA2_69_24]|nr:MAG: ATP-binding protein [Elusimicrobia bacterium GWA2_69_24]